MTRYRVRFTEEAEDDLLRLYEFLVGDDPRAARGALTAIRAGVRVLRFSPFACRKAIGQPSALLRELLIPFGKRGYVALFEIERGHVTIIAVRHQREDDYQ